MIGTISAPFWILLLYWTLDSLQAETHSLYSISTGLSKPVNLSGIHRFSTLGLLDDTEIDYYDSEAKISIPKQQWVMEKISEESWKKGTLIRRTAEQYFIANLNVVMKEMNHSKSDLHVLQERYGCEVEQQGDEVKIKGIDEYSYDGEDFLYFDTKESQWVASVEAALLTKKVWDNLPRLNQYIKEYLEQECVKWLNKFRKYADEELRNSSLPDVHVFAKKSNKDKAKLKLTCVATGFFHKDVMLTIRKYRTPIPDDETQSTGVRPNHDGSYQKRISVEIQQDETAEYDCYMAHRTYHEPVFMKWDGKCRDCPAEMVSVIIAAVIGVVLLLSVLALVVFILKKKGIIGRGRDVEAEISANGSINSQTKVFTVGHAGGDSDSGMADSSSSCSSHV